ncbi:MAG: GNAT family N-acetyltransferase [Alphaproteobacteria bacterium]|nr:GNAT family N-acetyltransferase [Alphaproteobacteria bacterium]
MARTFTIREMREADHDQWSGLWRGYLEFYEARVPDDVSDLTWRRLLDPAQAMQGFCAERDDGVLLGIVHYLFHPVTWSVGPRCYLEDLFASPEARGQGVGRALIEAVYAAADAQGADQVYWLTAETNATARRLYDSVATKTPFIKYRR